MRLMSDTTKMSKLDLIKSTLLAFLLVLVGNATHVTGESRSKEAAVETESVQNSDLEVDPNGYIMFCPCMGKAISLPL